MRDGDAVIGVNYRVGPHAADRSHADRPIVRRVRRVEAPDVTRHYPHVIRQDVRRAGRVPAAVDGEHHRRGSVGNGSHDAQDGGNREVPACDLLLQRGQRDSVPRRGPDSHTKPEGCDIRSDAGDERAGNHRRAVQVRSKAKSHDFILCNYANADMVGHSGSIEGDDRGGGDSGRVSCARDEDRPKRRERGS